MQGFEAGLPGVDGPHNWYIVALLGFEQLHLTQDAVGNPLLWAIGDLSQKEISIEIWYFFMDVGCV